MLQWNDVHAFPFNRISVTYLGYLLPFLAAIVIKGVAETVAVDGCVKASVAFRDLC